MKLPAFTAAASLYSASSYNHVHGRYHQTAQEVYAADYIDQACLGNCKHDCGKECARTAGQSKALCIHECARDNASCNTICKRPGTPANRGGPTLSGGPIPSSGGSACATPCGPGSCCPPSFPVCCPGATLCCPTGTTCRPIPLFGGFFCSPV